MKRLTPIIALTLMDAANPAQSRYFGFRQGPSLESGDSWTAEARPCRLYGVQSHLSGVSYTDKAGAQRDCGHQASLAMLASFINDASPVREPATQAAALTHVACYGGVEDNRINLGTMLITSGFAIAALDASGLPIYPSHALIGQDARDHHARLFEFDDVQHPAMVLSRTVREHNRRARQ